MADTDEPVTLIFGAGYSGRPYGRHLVARGQTVLGTTRSPGKAEDLKNAGIDPLLFGGETVDDALATAIGSATDLIVSVAPDAEGDPVLRAAREQIAAAPRLRWIAYLSTVGVYGNHDGAWVDERTSPRPVSERSRQRVRAEHEWQNFARERGVPLAIVRLSGIYGPGRNALVNLAEGRARRLVKPGQVFNRIHVDDITGALAFLADRRHDGIVNVTDDCPAPPQDVVAYAASVMEVDPPPEIDFENATLSPMARSFYGENKRVSNAAIKALGYAFRFPDHRAALERMWAEDSWR
ncbi:SDR family oxidoreductase [Roseitalea porphyridii]|uniref:SDR family oxidoreductase n=1 Tax=Roseitalea porphyridii TaxID=1852022 RepID=A0A4P6UY81_9HYPH|nr:SDR family oxidoreductase [Roseitalea porphyridii]QBK29309.1 SDR family oxidoreductase [Roseitalea porphyridii]